jgi:hypothetical protein
VSQSAFIGRVCPPRGDLRKRLAPLLSDSLRMKPDRLRGWADDGPGRPDPRPWLSPFPSPSIMGRVHCARCGELIAPGAPWDLGHSDEDRSVWSGPGHRRCHRATAARDAQRLLPCRRSWVRVPSALKVPGKRQLFGSRGSKGVRRNDVSRCGSGGHPGGRGYPPGRL